MTVTTKKFRNLWVARDYMMSRLIWGQEDVFPNQEAAEMEETRKCECGGKAFYSPPVGTWKCTKCNRVLCGNDWY